MVNKQELKYEIVSNMGVIHEDSKGWRKELNLISWNDAAPKYDIRDWNADHSKMGKGITLTEKELCVLQSLIEDEMERTVAGF